MDPNPHTQALLTETSAFEALIGAGSELDFSKLNRCRMSLLKAAQAFLVTENEQTRADRGAEVPGGRVQILGELNDLRIRHSGHIATWNPREVTQGWEQYLSASNALVSELRDLLEKRSVALQDEGEWQARVA